MNKSILTRFCWSFLPLLLNMTILFLTVDPFSSSAMATGQLIWTTKASMPTTRSVFASVASPENGKIYAIGGYDHGYLSRVEEYDPATDNWSAKADMPTPRDVLRAAAPGNGKIYAIGGYINTYNGVLNTVEEYDPITDTWAEKASMPTPREYFGVATLNGKIYAIGGRDNHFEAINTVEVYDPATDQWSTGRGMPVARYDLGVITLNGKIYAVGGRSNYSGDRMDIALEFDPGTDAWQFIPYMPTPRYYLELFGGNNGKLYAIGGYDNQAHVGPVEEYDPMQGSWSLVSNMPVPRVNFGVATISGKTYIMGGFIGSLVSTRVEEVTVMDTWPPLGNYNFLPAISRNYDPGLN